MSSNGFLNSAILVVFSFFVNGVNVHAQILKPTRGLEKVFTCEGENNENPHLNVVVYSDTLSGVSKLEFKNFVNGILDYQEFFAARQPNLSKEGHLVYLGKGVSFKVSPPIQNSSASFYLQKNNDAFKVKASLDIQSPGFKVHNFNLNCKYL